MRSLAVVALLSTACHHPAPTLAAPHEHPCDPGGPTRPPVAPKLFEYSATELDQNEQALIADKGCHLAITPAAPVPIDDVIVSDCTELAESYVAAKRSQCRHACIVDARQAAAGEVYTRVIAGLGSIATTKDNGHSPLLDACARQYGSAGTGETTKTDTVDGKHYWACAHLPPLPAAFTVIVEHTHGLPPLLVSIEVAGSMPALPPHTWKLEQQDHGCGSQPWGVEQIAPWPVPQ